MQGQPLSNREVEAVAQQYDNPAIKNYGQRNVGVERFPLVSTLSGFMRVLGLLLVLGGFIIFAAELMPWLTCTTPKTMPQQPGVFQPQVQGACPLAIWELGVGGVMFVIGLGIVAFGELLGIFRSIEGNTFNLLKTQEADYKARLAQGS